MKNEEIINQAWENKEKISKDSNPEIIEAIKETINLTDQGIIRVAEKKEGRWIVNQWIKKAILLSFRTNEMQPLIGPYATWWDKVKGKTAGWGKEEYNKAGFRMVPNGVVRHGAFIGKNVVLMPSFVNLGAYVDEGTMIDTWATVGSCAQIGKNVHLSGGVGIGGVLEPLQAAPVIIEDGAFIGSRCIVVEGVRVGKEAVLGANVVLTMSTKIIDVTGDVPVETKGAVPPRSVVIPGSYTKKFAAGEFNVPCALIIGKRKESTNKKTSLNDALREYDVAV